MRWARLYGALRNGLCAMVTAHTPKRIYWIDTLKAIVVVGIALFHSALVFTSGTWIVNNAQRSGVLGAFVAFTFPWGIALLFLLAGSATWFGLRSRGPLEFAGSRVIRLGLPLLAGLAVLSPLQFYLQHTQTIEPRGLLESYPTFWTSIRLSWRPSSAYDVVYHLWFLTHLLVISIATLPVVAWLRSSKGRRFTARVARLVDRRGGFLLGAIPFATVEMVLHPRFPLYQDWSDLVAWAVLYVEGFIIMSDPRFAAVLRRSLWPAVVAALSIVALLSLLNAAGYVASWDARPDYSAGNVTGQALRAVAVWCWLAFALGAGVRWLDRANRLSRWGEDRPLPFYVLSHPLIVLIAWYVVAWDFGVWAKFAVVAGLSIGITLAMCEVVSRHSTLRILFGLNMLPKPRHPVPAEPTRLSAG